MFSPKRVHLIKHFFSICFISVLCCNLFIQAKSIKPVDEWIRMKIENLSSTSSVFEHPIYCTASIVSFYQNREFQPAWNTNLAKELLMLINASEHEGLNPEDYHASIMKKLSVEALKSPTEKANYDLLLSDAFLLYCSHLQSGKVNPTTVSAEWHVTRREGDPVSILQQAIINNNLTTALQQVLPTHAEYASLKASLQTYAALTNILWEIIPEGETLKKGMNNERIPIIRNRLMQLGDLSPENNHDSQTYDEGLWQDVVLFQTRHGLENEGEIGKKTLTALNMTPIERVNQIKANMERWRWLPQTFGDYYLKVNIANFKLTVVKNKEVIAIHKIIAGKPARKTPVFSSTMQYVVFNPTWTVPPGIIKADLIPAVKKDISYLDKKKIALYDVAGNVVNASTVNWDSKQALTYTYRQPPGPNNALGAVKFMFPNNFQVYLHDTPNKELFDKTERAFSSGCIRVQNPLDLAIYLLNDTIKWNKKSLDKIIATAQSQTVYLKEKPDVYLLYWTVWADEYGKVNFRPDIYNRDNKLIQALNQSGSVLNK